MKSRRETGVARVVLAVLLIVGLLAVVISRSDSSEDHAADYEIIEGQMGEWRVFVPQEYLKLRNQRRLKDGVLYLLMKVSELTPISQTDQKEMWKAGEWHKKIRVLARFNENIQKSQHELTVPMIEHFNAYEVAGEEYGLTHLTQPDGYVKDHWDVWLESDERTGQYLSYTTCSDKIVASDVPQCSHHFLYQAGSRMGRVTVDFDKRLLPQWKEIRNDVVELFESFSSPETARAFIYERKRKASEKGRMQ